MGWIAMSERDVQRIRVLSEVVGGQRTIGSAASVLGVSMRQAHRLLIRLRSEGGSALAHRARGRPANNKMAECDGLRVSRETLPAG